MKPNGRYAILQTAIDTYRQHVFDDLGRHFGDKLRLFSGKSYFEPSLITRVEFDDRLRFVDNRFLFGRRLLWQSGMWRECLAASSLLIEGNPRILSSWILLVIRKALRRKNVLWMHAWPRGGRHSRSDALRHLLRMLGDAIVVYTEQQARELRDRMPNVKVIAAPNAILRRESMRAEPGSEQNNFIYVGRLTDRKKPGLCVEAFAAALPSLPATSRLLIVGDGPLKETLAALVKQLGVEDRVLLLGHISDEAILRPLYATAIASVSPGYVGLSITQSFSYGTPMIISRDETHAPEIEAAEEGYNCQYFTTDSVQSLADAFGSFCRTRLTWAERRAEIARRCSETYSIELMAERLITAMTI